MLLPPQGVGAASIRLCQTSRIPVKHARRLAVRSVLEPPSLTLWTRQSSSSDDQVSTIPHQRPLEFLDRSAPPGGTATEPKEPLRA